MKAVDVHKNVLFFNREIRNVKDFIDIDQSIAWRFIDVDKDNKIDEPAQELLHSLKRKVAECLPRINIIESQVGKRAFKPANQGIV